MTPLTWTGWPEQIDIKCPKCGERATYEDPFEFPRAKPKKRVPKPPRMEIGDIQPPKPTKEEIEEAEATAERLPEGHLRWGEWIVVEKFPNLILWDPPTGPHQELSFPEAREGSGHYAYMKHGAVQCGACGAVGVHDLDWPRDAFYQWAIGGKLLWAMTRDHALAIREFIASERRIPSGDFAPLLKQIPRALLKPALREAILQQIDASVAKS